MMAETTTLCVSVQAGDHIISGPDWLKVGDTMNLIDVLVEVSGTQALGYQVQVIVSNEPSFTEAALMQMVNSVSMLRTSGSIYVKFLLKASVLPSKQRYEETKCKAERDTDVPFIETLIKSTGEEQQSSHSFNELSSKFDKPFESNYLNKLLSEDKLSQTTLTSLRKELIKKKPIKECENYTTWQEQSVTSPVIDLKRVSSGPHVSKFHHDFTNWINGSKDMAPGEDGSSQEVGASQIHAVNQSRPSGDRDSSLERKYEVDEQNGGGSLMKRSEESSQTTGTSTSSVKTTTDKKEQPKKVAIRKALVPKTNRSTALRVKKNSTVCAETKKKEKKTESGKSGMPVLAQKTTQSALQRPTKTINAIPGLPKTKEGQAVAPKLLAKKAKGESIVCKEVGEKSNESVKKSAAEKGRRLNISRKNNRLDLRKKDNKTMEGKEGKNLSLNQRKLPEACKNTGKGQVASSKSNSSSPISEEATSAVNSEAISKTDGFKIRSEEMLITAGKGRFEKIRTDDVDNFKNDARFMEEEKALLHCDSLVATSSSNVLKTFTGNGDALRNAEDRVEDFQAVDGTQSGMSLPAPGEDESLAENEQSSTDAKCCEPRKDFLEASLTSTPNHLTSLGSGGNQPNFSFVDFDVSFTKEEAFDSVEELTIYESLKDFQNNDTNMDLIISNMDDECDASNGSVLHDFEKTLHIEESRTGANEVPTEASKTLRYLSDCDAKEKKMDSLKGEECEGDDVCSVHENLRLLPDKSKFFDALSRQSSHKDLQRGSYDSSDLIECSEMQRKLAMNVAKNVKRSESLDRNPKCTVPKRSGFFQDLKERTVDADTGIVSCLSFDKDDGLLVHIHDELCKEALILLHPELAKDNGILNGSHSPSNTDRSLLNVTIDKDDLARADLNSRGGQLSRQKSPTLMADIGRESAVSRTFSLENEKNNEMAPCKVDTKDDSSTKDAIKTASDATLNVFNMHGTNLEGDNLLEDKDKANVQRDIDFEEDMECHVRRKWSLEIDIIDQLLITSLRDQCNELNATAERILERLRAAENGKRDHEIPVGEALRSQSNSKSTNIGETGAIFKALQSLERKLNEIENNFGFEHFPDVKDLKLLEPCSSENQRKI